MAGAPRQSINLPANDLVASLELLGRQAGIEFIYDADQLKGVKAPDVSGNLTPLAAVLKLLAGTNFTVTEHNGAMLIAAPRAGGQPAPDPIPSLPGNAVPAGQRSSGRHEDAAIAGSSNTDQKSTGSSSLDEIIVTGTHIRGEAPVGSALTVYVRADIEQSGSATLEQFARNMTENFSGTDTIANQSSNIRFAPTSSSNGINTFQGAAFNLHGLGPGTTLTLLNGQRLAPGGLDGAFTDISQIPLSAVDHVEVLPDGALGILAELTASNSCVVGVLNNEARETNEFRLDKFGVRAHVKVALSSCYLGLRKPDLAIYKRALDILGRPAERILFIDDREENVASAVCAGMKGIRFTGAERLRAELASLGVI